MCRPSLYENLGKEQYFIIHILELQYVINNPTIVIKIPTGKIAA
jgi:hypothetical protein